MGSVLAVDTVGCCGGDGVLVGCEEEEFPAVVVGLVADHLAYLLGGVVRGCVFIAVGVDGDDDFSRAVLFRRVGELLANVINGAANGIE